MYRLELMDGHAEPALRQLGERIVLGRAREADVRIYDETASREHAVIHTEDGRTVLLDLGSANGTWLNGERIKDKAVLFDGDIVSIGAVRFRVASGDATERVTVVPTTEDRIEAAVDPDVAIPDVEGGGTGAARRLQLVCDGAALCADASDPGQLARDLLDLVVERLGADRATVCLTDREGILHVAAAHPPKAAPPSSRTLQARVLEQGEAVLVRDAADEEARASQSMLRSRYRSTLAAPLKTVEGVRGTVNAEALEPGTYDAQDLRALAAVARQAALALRTLAALSGARLALRQLSAEQVDGAPQILGTAPAMDILRQQITRAAQADAAVLVRGATGTGKELVARRLHAEGPRAKEPFVALNCAALVEGLLESEFFGHEKGAFTDAKERRDGRIQEAGKGTLFLDEVGDLPPSLQAKLLRVLSERSYTRLGGRDALAMDCRVVAATNRDLEAMVKAGTFREDLYYRLAVVVLELPPLRERREDIELLAEASLERLAARLGRRVPRLAEDAREALRGYAWPGNVRELLNVLERALVLLDGDTLNATDLPREVREGGDPVAEGPAVPEADAGVERGVLGCDIFELRRIEARAVAAALRRTGGKKGAAAQLLGVSWPTLNRKIRQYGLEAPWEDVGPIA